MGHGPEEDDFEGTLTNLLEDIPTGQQVTSTFDFSNVISKTSEHLFQSSNDGE